MAILWNGSLIPWIDENGDPYSGAKAYFFDFGTTTPMVTYTTADLSIPNDHPVVANSAGMFPPIFLAEQTIYRLRILDADGVTISDVDGISAPTTVVPDPPTSNTENKYLYQTGDLKFAWRTSPPTGYVRCNGRTIGAASSGATERANADCEDLFVFLWENDANLAVSGGRGATSAGDWAAAKTIGLPDFRGNVLVGLTGMGNTATTAIPTDLIDGGDGDVLGATAGEAEHVLTEAELASHTHTGAKTTATVPATGWGAGASPPGTIEAGRIVVGSGKQELSEVLESLRASTQNQTLDLSGGTSGETGSDTAHNNMQPSVFVPVFIKL